MHEQDRSAAQVAGTVGGGAVAAGGAATALSYRKEEILAGLDSRWRKPKHRPTPSPSPTPAGPPLTPPQASRFLAQATNGATRGEIDLVTSIGIPAWLGMQFAMPRGQTHWSWIDSLPGARDKSKYGPGGYYMWDQSIWKQLISAPDQLRQRVALALLDILVVGIEHLNLRYRHYAMASYMDLLLDHAFGNVRQLLGAITTNCAMADFLTFLASSKASGSGAIPDENYARELMQLFTIGLYELNQDGTPRLSNGKPIETYSQDDVSGLARVFTGLRLTDPAISSPSTLRLKLVIDASRNETGPSTFLGKTVSGGGMTAINAALDVIFSHPNMPPFFSRALIQRLVTSNPSPAYTRRVANVFANNGAGQRGDLKAVVHAILTDVEARDDGALTAPHTGKLRDPIQRFTGWARAFNASSASGQWQVGNKSGSNDGLAQSPGRAPSVFNFFRPGYTPPNSELSARGLVAPEMQLTDEQSVIGYLNLMSVSLVKGAGRGDVSADFGPLLPLVDDTAALVDEVNLVLAAGQLSQQTRSKIAAAIATYSTGSLNGKLARIRSAIMLTLAAPEYLVLQ